MDGLFNSLFRTTHPPFENPVSTPGTDHVSLFLKHIFFFLSSGLCHRPRCWREWSRGVLNGGGYVRILCCGSTLRLDHCGSTNGRGNFLMASQYTYLFKCSQNPTIRRNFSDYFRSTCSRLSQVSVYFIILHIFSTQNSLCLLFYRLSKLPCVFVLRIAARRPSTQSCRCASSSRRR